MYTIPSKVLEQHIAILGKTGSGKSYTAKGIAERLLREKRRVCIIDPTSGWYGLRSDVTGKKPAFPIVVFGGEHGDVPLGQNHGAAIAEIIATTDTSAILDTRHMTVGERTRFFTDFAETLLRKNKGPLQLIIDEAHVFAPQGRVNDPQSGKMLHAANNLVSLGRGIGLRIILISQRPAKLHKDSLTQAETLIAMRLIAPQDRRAVEDWIGEWADPAKGKQILASLPSLPTGEGWIWSPEVGILERVTFPKITTYDTSRAPDGESGKIVLANIDLPSIQARLETVASDAFNDDPKRLRARIAELERAAKSSPVSAPAPPPTIIDKPVLSNGHLDRLESAAASLASSIREVEACGKIVADALKELKTPGLDRISAPKSAPLPSRPIQVKVVNGEYRPPAVNGDGNVGKGLGRNILTVLAQYPHGMGLERLAALARSTVSGHFNNTVGNLRTSGYITPARVSPIQITQEGVHALGNYDPLPMGADLRLYWVNRLGAGLGSKILRTLIQSYPRSLSLEELAAECDSSVSGHFNNTIGSLRTMGLMTPARTPILASENLFTE